MLTERDKDILMTLCHRVRALSLAQVSAHWWTGKADATRKRLERLRHDGLIDLDQVLAHPELSLSKPLFAWTPGADEPAYGSLSWALKKRWHAASGRTLIATATHRAAGMFGGFGGRKPRASETSHDLSLAAVYLHLRTAHPARAKGWVSEAQLYEQGEGDGDRLPDAMIRTRSERTVIEFGGAYGKGKLQDFHRYCADRELPYELW